jgi:hypothetical protein
MVWHQVDVDEVLLIVVVYSLRRLEKLIRWFRLFMSPSSKCDPFLCERHASVAFPKSIALSIVNVDLRFREISSFGWHPTFFWMKYQNESTFGRNTKVYPCLDCSESVPFTFPLSGEWRRGMAKRWIARTFVTVMIVAFAAFVFVVPAVADPSPTPNGYTGALNMSVSVGMAHAMSVNNPNGDAGMVTAVTNSAGH